MRSLKVGLVVLIALPFITTVACGRPEPAIPELAAAQEVELPRASTPSARESSSASAARPIAELASGRPEPERSDQEKPELGLGSPFHSEPDALAEIARGFGAPSGSALTGGSGVGGLGARGGSGVGVLGGYGIGRLAGVSGSGPRLRLGRLQLVGALAPELVQRIVRQNFGRLRLCYENGLRTNPRLAGAVTLRLVIASDGATKSASLASTDLPDKAVVACVVRGLSGLAYPKPQFGEVVVLVPIELAPPVPAAPPPPVAGSGARAAPTSPGSVGSGATSAPSTTGSSSPPKAP